MNRAGKRGDLCCEQYDPRSLIDICWLFNVPTYSAELERRSELQIPSGDCFWIFSASFGELTKCKGQ